MKTYWGSADIAPRILDLSTRLRPVVSFTPRPRYNLDRRLGGPQSRYGHSVKEKYSHHSTSRELNPGHSTRRLVSVFKRRVQIRASTPVHLSTAHHWGIIRTLVLYSGEHGSSQDGTDPLWHTVALVSNAAKVLM
jgi:hypothetical protein